MGNRIGFWHNQPGASGTLVPNNEEFSGVAGPGINGKFLISALQCQPNCVYVGQPTQAWIGELEIELTDTRAPTIDSLGGTLLAPSPPSGVATLDVAATDVGGGLASFTVAVNGTPLDEADLSAGCAIPDDVGSE